MATSSAPPMTFGTAAAEEGGSSSSSSRSAGGVSVGAFAAALRPWGNFFVPVRRDGNAQEWRRRAEENLAHFQANYILLATAALLLLALLLGRSSWFVASAVMFILGVICVQRPGGDLSPEGAAAAGFGAKVAGLEVSSGSRWLLLCAVSLLTVYMIAGEGFLIAAALLFCACACHAALHPGAVAVGDYSFLGLEPDL